MSELNITVYNGASAWQAAREIAAIKKDLLDGIVGDLIDPILPGTQSNPAVIPPGPGPVDGKPARRKFTPQPGFYEGFQEVTSYNRWEFYWDGVATWSLFDLGSLPKTEISSTFDPTTLTQAQGGKQIADYIESFSFSDQSSIGSTSHTNVFGLVEDEAYYFNRTSFETDRYIHDIEMYTESLGDVIFAFGSLVNEKFVEREVFVIPTSAPLQVIKSYAINSILLSGEVIAIKTPSVGMSWNSKSPQAGNLWQSDGYDGTIVKTSGDYDLSLKINSSNFERMGYTPIKLYNILEDRIKKVELTVDPTIITIGKLSGDFRSITEAVAANKSNRNPVMMIVYPGVYEGTVELQDVESYLNISIVAAIPGTVTVLQRLGDYYKPPMHVWVNSYFDGLTFKSTQELGLKVPASYCVHSDWQQPWAHVPALIEYNNCIFDQYVSTAQAYGAGSWQDHTLRFRSCRFLKHNTQESAGALYWHNKVQNGVTNQRLEAFYCYFESLGGPTLQLHDANQTNGGGTGTGTSQASALFVGNTFNSLDLAVSVNDSFLRMENERQPGALVGNIYLDHASHGNNIDALNYR